MIVQLIDYIRERQRFFTFVFFGIVAAVCIWTFRVDLHHAHTWAEHHVPVFWGFFGFISATLIIFFSRWFGRGGIKTREDYYDN